MRNLVRTGLLVLTVCLLFTACGSPASSEAPDAESLAARLMADVSFDEELNALDSSAAERVYRLDPELIAANAVYIGTGASVDEVCVIEASSSEAAKEIETALQARIEQRKADYADYKPEEVPKLDDAILERNGSLVVLCVTSDTDTARSILDDTLN